MGDESTLPDDTYTLDSTTRRTFLSALLGTGALVPSLRRAVASEYGEEPEGKPIVHTYDVHGNPKRVRFVSEERYEKLSLLRDVPDGLLRQEGVNGVSLEQQSDHEADFRMLVHVQPGSGVGLRQARRRVPDRAQGVPLEVVEEPAEFKPDYCSERHRDGDVRGGMSVNGESGSSSYGTVTLVAYDGSGDPVALTADHVMEGADEMYVPKGDDKVGEFAARSPQGRGEDVTAYELDVPSYDYDPLEVEDVPDVSGAWDFFGIADHTFENGPIEVQLSGANNCTASNEIVSQRRGGINCYHEVIMDERAAGGGDSGGPWVDDDGNLAAVHSGCEKSWWGLGGCKYDIAAAGQQALDAVNAQLSQ